MKQRASHPEAKASLRIAAPGTWDNIFQSCVTKTRGTVKPCVQPAAVAQQLAHSTHSPPHTHTHTHTDTHTRPSPITLVLDPELNVVANLIRHVHSHSHSHWHTHSSSHSLLLPRALNPTESRSPGLQVVWQHKEAHGSGKRHRSIPSDKRYRSIPIDKRHRKTRLKAGKRKKAGRAGKRTKGRTVKRRKGFLPLSAFKAVRWTQRYSNLYVWTFYENLREHDLIRLGLYIELYNKYDVEYE